MGLMNMEDNLQNMLKSIKEEIESDETKKEKVVETKPKETVSMDDLLKDIPDLMTKERKKYEDGMHGKKKSDSAFEKKKPETVVEKKSAAKTERVPAFAMDIEELKKLKQKQRHHILIVDDDIRILKMMKEILKNNYDTAVASNGDIALKFLEKHDTDLILLDYMMPGENGKEVLERIRQNPRYYNVPVFFLTGMSDADKVQECLALRPQGYMLKPVKPFELLKRVKEILG